MSKICLFHVGNEMIKNPDIHYGRANADFGQGFYLSPDRSFSQRWAKRRKDRETFLNVYTLETEQIRKLLDIGPAYTQKEEKVFQAEFAEKLEAVLEG